MIRLGLGVNQTDTTMQSAGGDPGDYFRPGDVGFYVDPNLSLMSLSETGSSPDTAENLGPGAVIAWIEDLSGLGNTLTQATLGNRPLLQQDPGGCWYLQFVSNDFLASTVGFATPHEIQVAVEYTTPAANMAATGSSAGTFLHLNASSQVSATNGVAITTGRVAGTGFKVSHGAYIETGTSDQVFGWKQGYVGDAGDVAVANIRIGADGAGANGLVGKIYGAFAIDRELTERAGFWAYYRPCGFTSADTEDTTGTGGLQLVGRTPQEMFVPGLIEDTAGTGGLLIEGQPVTEEGLVAFTPADLFASGEQGGWYDPSDLSSMRVGRKSFSSLPGVGTFFSAERPASGDTVGTIFDKSQIGDTSLDDWFSSQAELLNTESDTGWIENIGASIASVSGGTITFSGTGSNYFDVRYPVATTIGSTYYMECKLDSSTSDSIVYIFKDTVASGTGTREFAARGVFNDTDRCYTYFTATTTTTYFTLSGDLIPTATLVFSGITVKELPGNPLTTPSDAARPVLRQSGELYYLDFDGVDDRLGSRANSLDITGVGTFCAAWDHSNADTDTHVWCSDDSTNFIAVMQDGNGSSIDNGAGTVSHRLSGAPSNWTTRDNVFDAMKDTVGVVTSEADDLSAWDGLTYGARGDGALGGLLRLFGGLLVDRSITTTERSHLEEYMAEKSGVTLP